MCVLQAGGGIEAIFWVLLWTKILSLLVFVGYFFYCRLDIAQNSSFSFDYIQKVVKVIPVFFINTLLYVLVCRLDFFVLSFYESPEKIAFYAISYRLLEISMVAVAAICMVLLPKFSLINHTHSRYFLSAARTVMLYFVLIVFFVSLGGILFAYEYVKWFFPTQFDKPVYLSIYFSGIIFICALDYFFSILLHSSNQERADLKALAIGSVIFTLCLLWLVPIYGALGAFLSCAIVPVVQTLAKVNLSTLSVIFHRRMHHIISLLFVLSIATLLALSMSHHGFFYKVIALLVLSTGVLGFLILTKTIKLKRQFSFVSKVFDFTLVSKENNDAKYTATEVAL